MPQALRKSTQQVPTNQTPGGDLQTGVRQANSPVKGAESLRGSSGRGSCASTRKKHKGEQDICTKTTPTPRETVTAGVGLSQVWNSRRAASCMTQSGKTAGAPGQADQTHQRSPSKSLRYPQKEERKKKQHCGYRKKNHKHKDRDHQRMWPAAKTPKASNLRRERERERERGE